MGQVLWEKGKKVFAMRNELREEKCLQIRVKGWIRKRHYLLRTWNLQKEKFPRGFVGWTESLKSFREDFIRSDWLPFSREIDFARCDVFLPDHTFTILKPKNPPRTSFFSKNVNPLIFMAPKLWLSRSVSFWISPRECGLYEITLTINKNHIDPSKVSAAFMTAFSRSDFCLHNNNLYFIWSFHQRFLFHRRSKPIDYSFKNKVEVRRKNAVFIVIILHYLLFRNLRRVASSSEWDKHAFKRKLPTSRIPRSLRRKWKGKKISSLHDFKF